MTITIGGAAHDTRRPRNLDEQLLASTGHDAKGVAELLHGSPPPDLAARALAPFLGKEGAAVPDLARAMAAAGMDAVLPQLRALYGEPPEPEPAPATPDRGPGQAARGGKPG